MRNTPLKAFAKRSPVRQIEAVAESTSTPKVREVKIVPKKKKKPGVKPADPGIIYDPGKKRLDAAIQANPLATIFTGRKTKS